MASIHPSLSLKWDLVGVDVGLQREVKTALSRLEKFREIEAENPPEFLQLPDQDLGPILSAVRSLSRFRHLVVLGIGGSSLGAETVVSLHKDLNREITFLDNLDPFEVRKVLQHGDPETTGYIAVSKSGTTPEILAQLSLLVQHTKAQLGEKWRERWLVITDQEKGPLRAFAEAETLASLPFPTGVAGRYSVLSPAGIVPAAWSGVKIGQLLAGAKELSEAWLRGDKAIDPLMKVAALYYLLHVKKNKTISVMMPYGSRFRRFGDWYSQLWAESLGKPSGKNSTAGSTPLPAIGTTDQHSLLQMFVEGADDKMYSILTVEEHGATQSIPDLFPGDDAKYLVGHSVEQLSKAESDATIRTLRMLGRPVIHLKIPKVEERATGELLMAYELITIMAAHLYKVNPYDQPGVEACKVLTRKLLSDLPIENR